MKFLATLINIFLVVLGGVFFYFIYQQAINIPYLDDYAFFDYTLRLVDAPSISEFWQVLWAEHGGHRIVLTKLSFLIQYLLTGEINFRQKILFETLLIGAFWGLSLYAFRKNSIPSFYLLPVGLILFSPIYYMNVFWSMTILSHVGTILLITFCFYFLCSVYSYSFCFAVLTAIAATLNNGNGWLSIFMGGVLLLYQKRYLRLTVWLFFCCILAALHLIGNIPAPSQKLELLYVFQTICVFLGSAFFFVRGYETDSFYGGLFLLAATLTLLFTLLSVRWEIGMGSKFVATISKKITDSSVNSALPGVLGCILITAIGAGVMRQSKVLTVWPHYMIYSVFTVISVYMLAIILMSDRYRIITGVLATGIACLIAIGGLLFALPESMVFQKQLLANAFKLRYGKMDADSLVYVNPVTIGYQRFPEAIKRGMYYLPSTPMDSLSHSVFGEQIDSSLFSDDYRIQIQKESDTGRTIGLSNQTLFVGGKELVYVLLKNKHETYLIAPKPMLVNNRKVLFTTGTIFRKGFLVSLLGTNYRSGDYNLGLIVPTQQGLRVVYTRQQITIKNPDKD